MSPRRREGKKFASRLVFVAIALIAASLVSYYFVAFPSVNRTGQSTPVSIINSSPQSSKYVTEYPVDRDSQPNAIATDTGGNVWFTMGRNVALGELSPSNGTVHEFYLPLPKNSTLLSWGIVVDSAIGRVWFTDQFNNAIWSFEIHSRSFSMHALPSPLSGPFQIAQDSGGNVWFTEVDGNKIGEIANDGSTHEFKVPLGQKYNVNSGSAGPAGITIDDGGRIWFTEVYADAIGSLSNGHFQEFRLDGEVQAPTGIAVEASGRVWLTEHGPSFIAEFEPQSHSLRSISTSVGGVKATLPYFVQVDHQGNVWFNEHYGNAIAKLVPSTGTLIEYRIPSKIESAGNISGALTLALSPSGQPWFTELETGKIGTIIASEAPGLGIRFSNATSTEKAFAVPAGGNVSLGLSVTGENEIVTLRSSVGSPTTDLSLRLVPASGRGNFTSTLFVVERRTQSSDGISYLITVSAVSRDIIVSQIITIKT